MNETPTVAVQEVVGPFRLLERLWRPGADEQWLAVDDADELVRVERRPPWPGGELGWRMSNGARARRADNVVRVRAAFVAEGEDDVRTADPPAGVTFDRVVDALRDSRGRTPLGVTLRLTRDIARALAAVQRLGPPGHVLLPARMAVYDHAIEIGFDGVARLRPELADPGTDDAVTVGGRRPSTALAWVPRELVLGAPVTPSSAVWQAGVALYALAAGARPFGGDNPVALLQRIHRGEVRPVTHVSPVLVRLFERCLAPHPLERPACAADLADELTALLSEHEPTTREDVARFVRSLLPGEWRAFEQLREELAIRTPSPAPEVERRPLAEAALDPAEELAFLRATSTSVEIASWRAAVRAHAEGAP